MSQTKLASYLRVSPAAVNNYEAGLRQIPVHYLVVVASHCNKPLHFFIPDMQPENIALTSFIETFSRVNDTVYLQCRYELDKQDKLVECKKPYELISFPKDYEGANFVIRKFHKDSFGYYLCILHKPRFGKRGILPFGKSNLRHANIKENDFVLTWGNLEDLKGKKIPGKGFCRFRDVPPSADYRENEDPRNGNVYAVVAAIIGKVVN